MGTDIHVKILHKVDGITYEHLTLFTSDNKDISWRAPYCNRNYPLFGLLAGTRHEATAMVPLRGIFEHCPSTAIEDWFISQKDVDEGFSANMLGEKYVYDETWYDWCELVALSQTNAAIAFDYDGEPYNPVIPWIEQLRFVLDCYEIYYPKPGEIIIQIAFDN